MAIGKSVLSIRTQRVDGFADPDPIQFPAASHKIEALAVTAGISIGDLLFMAIHDRSN